MKKVLMALVMVAVTAGPALAFQCPLLIKQIEDATAGKSDADSAKAKELAAEAKSLHAAGKHVRAHSFEHLSRRVRDKGGRIPGYGPGEGLAPYELVHRGDVTKLCSFLLQGHCCQQSITLSKRRSMKVVRKPPVIISEKATGENFL